MPTSGPLLTIAIPTYNRSGFLNRCLNSFLNQGNLENVEILVSNNASNDDTLLIVEKFKGSFPTFTIIENKDSQQSFSHPHHLSSPQPHPSDKHVSEAFP